MFKIEGIIKAEIEVDEREIYRAIFQKITQHIGSVDDAGCDWCTDKESSKVCINNNPDWVVSRNKNIVILVDAANIFLYGHPLKLKEEE